MNFLMLHQQPDEFNQESITEIYENNVRLHCVITLATERHPRHRPQTCSIPGSSSGRYEHQMIR